MSKQRIRYPKELKSLILAYCLNVISNKIADITAAILTSREGILNETKSSAGDKHETSRAMMQIDIEQYQVQLQKVRETEHEINSISIDESYTVCSKGSLVTTDQGIYFLGPGIGKISIESIELYAISILSPLGLQMINKKEGEEFQFQNKFYKIIQID